MNSELLHDRGRGPEIVGTRITVYNLIEYFLDPTVTEAFVCRLYDLSPKQVAAARAYVLNNYEAVLTEHLRIERRIAAGNPPEVLEQMERTHAKLLQFKEELARREQSASREPAGTRASQGNSNGLGTLPTFEEWLAAQPTDVRPREGT